MDYTTIIGLATAVGAGAILDRIVGRFLGRKTAQVELAAAAVAVAEQVLAQVRIELEKCQLQLIETKAALEVAQHQIFALRAELAAYRRETGSEDFLENRQSS